MLKKKDFKQTYKSIKYDQTFWKVSELFPLISLGLFDILNFKSIFLPAGTFSFLLSTIKMSSTRGFSNQPFVAFWQLTLIWISTIISSLSQRKSSNMVKLTSPLPLSFGLPHLQSAHESACRFGPSKFLHFSNLVKPNPSITLF